MGEHTAGRHWEMWHSWLQAGIDNTKQSGETDQKREE